MFPGVGKGKNTVNSLIRTLGNYEESRRVPKSNP